MIKMVTTKDKKTLVELTEDEFIVSIEGSIQLLEKERLDIVCQEQELYKIYFNYLKDKEKNYIQCYTDGEHLMYDVKKREPIGFKIVGGNYNGNKTSE